MLVTTFKTENQDGINIMVALNPQDLNYLHRGHTNRVQGEPLQEIGLPGVASITVTATDGSDQDAIDAIRRQTTGDVVIVPYEQ